MVVNDGLPLGPPHIFTLPRPHAWSQSYASVSGDHMCFVTVTTKPIVDDNPIVTLRLVLRQRYSLQVVHDHTFSTTAIYPFLINHQKSAQSIPRESQLSAVQMCIPIFSEGFGLQAYVLYFANQTILAVVRSSSNPHHWMAVPMPGYLSLMQEALAPHRIILTSLKPQQRHIVWAPIDHARLQALVTLHLQSLSAHYKCMGRQHGGTTLDVFLCPPQHLPSPTELHTIFASDVNIMEMTEDIQCIAMVEFNPRLTVLVLNDNHVVYMWSTLKPGKTSCVEDYRWANAQHATLHFKRVVAIDDVNRCVLWVAETHGDGLEDRVLVLLHCDTVELDKLWICPTLHTPAYALLQGRQVGRPNVLAQLLHSTVDGAAREPSVTVHTLNDAQLKHQANTHVMHTTIESAVKKLKEKDGQLNEQHKELVVHSEAMQNLQSLREREENLTDIVHAMREAQSDITAALLVAQECTKKETARADKEHTRAEKASTRARGFQKMNMIFHLRHEADVVHRQQQEAREARQVAREHVLQQQSATLDDRQVEYARHREAMETQVAALTDKVKVAQAQFAASEQAQQQLRRQHHELFGQLQARTMEIKVGQKKTEGVQQELMTCQDTLTQLTATHKRVEATHVQTLQQLHVAEQMAAQSQLQTAEWQAKATQGTTDSHHACVVVRAQHAEALLALQAKLTCESQEQCAAVEAGHKRSRVEADLERQKQLEAQSVLQKRIRQLELQIKAQGLLVSVTPTPHPPPSRPTQRARPPLTLNLNGCPPTLHPTPLPYPPSQDGTMHEHEKIMYAQACTLEEQLRLIREQGIAIQSHQQQSTTVQQLLFCYQQQLYTLRHDSTVKEKFWQQQVAMVTAKFVFVLAKWCGSGYKCAVRDDVVTRVLKISTTVLDPQEISTALQAIMAGYTSL
jgi:hypothetical protein